jgi:hypothetical protein
MLIMLGVLFGFAIRQAHYLELQIAPLFWKLVIGEIPNLQDLENIDRFTTQVHIFFFN